MRSQEKMKQSIFVLLALIAFYASANQIVSPPRMVKQPPNDELFFQVAENDKPLVIDCEATGNPAPRYTWMKNGKVFNYTTNEDRITTLPSFGSLVIAKPRDEDEGQYQCFATNEWGVATSNSVFVRKAKLNVFQEKEVQTKTVNEGESFSLSCASPDSSPKPYVFWLIQDYNGTIKSINNSRLTIDPEGTLWFSNVTQDDVSKDFYYVCAASTQARNEIQLGNRFTLNVIPVEFSNSYNNHEPVRQYVTRKNEVAYRGNKAELFCIFGGTPLPDVIWSKDGERIKTSDRITHGHYGKSLLIKRVDFQDEGTYTCEVSNGVGRATSYSINLLVKSAPYFTVEPEIVNAAEDEFITFNCEAHGVPKPDIEWLYNGKPIAEAPYNPRRQVTKNSIIIKDVTKYDIGNYGCNATNTIGYVYKDVYVNIFAFQPEITQPPSDIGTVEGKNVILTCRVFGAPKPTIKWVHNNQELTDERYRTLENGDLEINKINSMDSGVYTCIASNKFGQDERNATIFIKK